MSIFSLFCIMSLSFGVIMLLCLPWVVSSSDEAKRMLTVVVSAREDKRNIGILESLLSLVIGETHRLRMTLGQDSNNKIKTRFAEAGFHGPYVTELFLAGKICSFISGVLLSTVILHSSFFWILVSGLVAFVVPDFWLGAQQKRRRKRIRRSIPDMVDLLVICVGVGLGLDQALTRVTEEMRLSHPDLSQELERVLLERNVGSSRLDAWRALAERTRLEEIVSFVSMLSETDRFGSPITAALSQFSDELRTKRRQSAEEAAAKTKINIIFPLVLCIFPCIFIVLLVPAVLGFFHSFGNLGR